MKLVVFTQHAKLRFLERQIPLEFVEKSLANGVRLIDPISGASLYIYKYGETHYTLVVEEEAEKIIAITCYESSQWQVNHFHKVKKT